MATFTVLQTQKKFAWKLLNIVASEKANWFPIFLRIITDIIQGKLLGCTLIGLWGNKFSELRQLLQKAGKNVGSYHFWTDFTKNNAHDAFENSDKVIQIILKHIILKKTTSMVEDICFHIK